MFLLLNLLLTFPLPFLSYSDVLFASEDVFGPGTAMRDPVLFLLALVSAWKREQGCCC